MITVSRETGSGGRLIAQEMAKELRFDYYDEGLVELIAKKAKRKKEIIEVLDEKTRDTITQFIEGLLRLVPLSNQAYFNDLCKVILALSKKGKAVILGRGANFIIPQDQCLRVRIIAPLKTRIKNSIKYEGNKPLKARRKIRKIHFERKNFVKKYFLRDISNANYYDLVVNTKNFDIEQTAKIIIAGYKNKFPRGFIYP